MAKLHGNVSFEAQYFERAIGEAIAEGAGLAFLHSHPVPGWQAMSRDDVAAEQSNAGAVFGATGLPFLGLTTGSDGTWSARFWVRERAHHYVRHWCRNVRVVGDAFRVDFADNVCPPPGYNRALDRTISAWGPQKQATVSRLRVGVVGAGSVGAIVAEALARTGVGDVILIDFDHVQEHNLDRLLHAAYEDVRDKRLKVAVCAESLRRTAISTNFCVTPVPLGIHQVSGYEAALNCDVLFSCVDRPLPRHLLNLISQAHAIPVVDGGIFVRRNAVAGLVGADWRAHVAGPQRRCLACIGQYDVGLVQADREGLLDDPSYLEALPDDHPIKCRENVFAFSVSCASLMVLQFLQMVVAPLELGSPSRQLYHFVPGILDSDDEPVGCDLNCSAPQFLAKGDEVRSMLGLLSDS